MQRPAVFWTTLTANAITSSDYAQVGKKGIMTVKRTTVRVTINHKGRVYRQDWPGYLSSTPGLAIICEVIICYASKGSMPIPGDLWTITHIESGYAVDLCHGFVRRKDAEEMAKYLGQYCDWTLGKYEIVRAEPFRHASVEIAAKAKAIMAGNR